jgi:hypothetical protein
MTPIESIKLRLKNFAAVGPESPDLVWGNCGVRLPIDRAQFPTPILLLYLLNDVCGFQTGCRGDKTHWIIPFTYKGLHYAISHEKSGLRIYSERGADSKPKEVLGKLQKALESAEKHILRDIAQDQIKKGNITIRNRFSDLDEQYRYFRHQAASAYSPEEALDKEPKGLNFIAESLNKMVGAGMNGGFNALAMIDVYFSRLEHFLVLVFPFGGYNRDEDNLAEFAGFFWSEKFRKVLDLKDKETHRFYEELVRVKEKYRNTFAHGTFEKEGQSFFFHLEKYGAVPASMSGMRDSVHFNFLPIEQDGFGEICKLFDSLDTFLSKKALPNVWRFADSGLNLAIDPKNLNELIQATKDAETYETWIERQCHFAAMYANADY